MQLGQVEGVQRLSQVEHHVVGHVHGEADRPHTRSREPVAHPLRARCHGVDAAHDAGDVSVRARTSMDRGGVIGDAHIETVLADGSDAVRIQALIGAVGGVGETGAGGVGVFASDPAH